MEREASLLASVLAEDPLELVPDTGVLPLEVVGVVPVLGVELVVLLVDPVVDPLVDPVVGVVEVVGELPFFGEADDVPVETGGVAVPVPEPPDALQVTPAGAFWTVNLSE